MGSEYMEDQQCIVVYKHFFQKNLLSGRVALVTGGATGICFTISELLLRHGAAVVIASRNRRRLDSAVKILRQNAGIDCIGVEMDVRNPKQIASAVQAALTRFGKIDILVNGAAGNFLCPADDLSFNAFKTVIDIDLLGTYNVSKVVYHQCFKQQSSGVIINITATLHFRGQVMQSHAGSAKAAIEALTRHLAVEWGQKNIRVICIAPGPIADTEGFRKLGGTSVGADYFKASIPLGRAGTRSDVGHAALYLASEAASYVTGTTLVVDGGDWLTNLNGPRALERISSML